MASPNRENWPNCLAVAVLRSLDSRTLMPARRSAAVNQALKRFFVEFCVAAGHAVVQVLVGFEWTGGPTFSNDVFGHGFQTADALETEADATRLRQIPAHGQVDIRREQLNVTSGGLAEILAGLVTVFYKSVQ